METLLEYKDDVMIVRLSGELDQHYATTLRSNIDSQVAHRGIHKIVFDFSKVGFMDSSGIGVIMGRYRLMQSVGGRVCAFGVSPRLDKLIEMSGIKRIVSVYEDETTALRKEG
ncbi:MAG: anti-sigma F factor antagonist [Clostridia bacterium]|nr:anti-sigma F factor antagonist [Clostridia bacterium]